MADKSKISWTDATFNPWTGCTKVSPGCDNCYAESWSKRSGLVQWGAGQPRRMTSDSNWGGPVRWNNRAFYQCEACGWRGESDHKPGEDGICGTKSCFGHKLVPARRRVFSSSLADWLDNEVSAAWRIRFLHLVWQTPNLDWLLLTKRIGNFERLISEVIELVTSGSPEVPPRVQADEEALAAWLLAWLNGKPPANVWVGATIVNQAEVDRDIDKLLNVPALVRFLSMEPLLGEADLSGHLPIENVSAAGWRPRTKFGEPDSGIHWIIVGAESGAKARPIELEWIRGIAQQTLAAGVALHVKQLGQTIYAETDDPWGKGNMPLPANGRFVMYLSEKKGGDTEEWPADLRVQQFPTTERRP